jgi:hypothetical protein
MATLIANGQIAGGESQQVIWNNPPTGVAHSFTAEPFCPDPYAGLQSTDAVLEITGVVFERQFVKWDPPPQGQIAGTPIFHLRVLVTIKNTGTQPAGFNLYMSWS